MNWPKSAASTGTLPGDGSHLVRCCKKVVALIPLATGVLSGCALSYDDSLGHRHVIGFVDMSVVPVDQGHALAGKVIAIRSLGALMSKHENETILGLGYTSEATATIENNALVLGNPNTEIEKILRGVKR